MGNFNAKRYVKEAIEDLLYRYEKIRVSCYSCFSMSERFRYVPTEAMRSIARYFDIPESRVSLLPLTRF